MKCFHTSAGKSPLVFFTLHKTNIQHKDIIRVHLETFTMNLITNRGNGWRKLRYFISKKTRFKKNLKQSSYWNSKWRCEANAERKKLSIWLIVDRSKWRGNAWLDKSESVFFYNKSGSGVATPRPRALFAIIVITKNMPEPAHDSRIFHLIYPHNI